MPPRDIQSDVYYADALAHGPESNALAQARFGTVVALVATELSAVDQVARSILQWGGTIEFREDRVGYLRATIPIRYWPELQIADGIAAARLDGSPTLLTWKEKDSWLAARQSDPGLMELDVPRASVDTDPKKPTLRHDEAIRAPFNQDHLLGLNQFRRENPTFDGRGTTIAIVETDATTAIVDAPALRAARALDGTAVPKIRDWVLPDPRWRKVSTLSVIRSSETLVRTESGSWFVPSPGEYRFGELKMNYQLYPVLWDPRRQLIWLDLNRDRDFRNDSAMHDARRRLDVGTFPSGAFWPGARFVVTCDGDSVLVHPLSGTHATMTSSVTAGIDDDVNLAQGVAPGAQIVLIDVPALSAHGYLEALIIAARRLDVDVISSSTTSLQDHPESSRSLATLMVDRIVTAFGKPVVQAAGNYMTVESQARPGSSAVIVGAYIHSDAAYAYYGVTPGQGPHVIWPYSERGASPDGAVKPDLVAPAERIAASRCEIKGTKLPRQAYTRMLPPCYMFSIGTSAAAPAVSGLLASIISGAKQRQLVVTAAQLRTALISSARPLPGLRPIDQGAGLPQADRMWRALSLKVEPLKLLTSSGIFHALSEYSGDSSSRRGLYLREPPVADGQLARAQITVTRQNGYAPPTAYDVRWFGDKSVQGPSRLRLPLNESVNVPVAIAPDAGSGVHSVLMQLLDPRSKSVVYEQPITWTIADTFRADRGYELNYRGTLDLFGREEHGFVVPSQTTTLIMRINVSGTSLVRLYEPSGWNYHRQNFADASFSFPLSGPKQYEFAIPNPAAGTWYLIVGRVAATPGERDERLDYTAQLSVVSVTMTVARSAEGELLARFANRAADVALAPRAEPAIANEQDVLLDQVGYVRQIEVPPQVGTLLLRVRNKIAGATVHSYVYDCTSGTCVRFDSGVPASAEQATQIANPSSGVWKLVVTPGPNVAGPTMITIEETLTIGPRLLLARRSEPNVWATDLDKVDLGCANAVLWTLNTFTTPASPAAKQSTQEARLEQVGFLGRLIADVLPTDRLGKTLGSCR